MCIHTYRIYIHIQNIHYSVIFCILTNTKVTLHCCIFIHNKHCENTGVYFVYLWILMWPYTVLDLYTIYTEKITGVWFIYLWILMWLYTVVYLYTIYTKNILVYIFYTLEYRVLVKKTVSSRSRNDSQWRRFTRAQHAWSILLFINQSHATWIIVISIYKLGDDCISSNLIGSLSLTNGHWHIPNQWIAFFACSDWSKLQLPSRNYCKVFITWTAILFGQL